MKLQKSVVKQISIADYVTMINAVCGFLSIIFILENKIHLSFSLILLSIIFDGLDGIISRRTYHSDIGVHLDSMADLISMIFATSIFVYFSYFKNVYNNIFYYIFILILIFFILCGIIRLASFYLNKNDKYFLGLPAPASAIILITLSYINLNFYYMLLVLIITSFAMISSIHFLKPKIIMNAIASVLIVLVIIFGNSFNSIIIFIFLLNILLYSIVGPIYLKIRYNNKLKKSK